MRNSSGLRREGKGRKGIQHTLKSLPLPPQILLTRIPYRHETCIHSKPILRRLRRHVIMRNARVPHNKIARVGADFVPCEAVVGQPFHAGGGEAVPFRGPGGDAGFVGHGEVELGGEEVAAGADYEAAVVGAGRVEVDKALEAWRGGLVRVERGGEGGETYSGSRVWRGLGLDGARVCWRGGG